MNNKQVDATGEELTHAESLEALALTNTVGQCSLLGLSSRLKTVREGSKTETQ